MENNHEVAMTSLEAMLSQEDAYVCKDFILQDVHDDARWLVWRTGLLNHEDLAMNRAFRSTMVGWAHQVIDFMRMRRETVDFAASFFDRFLQTSWAADALKDRVTYQLAFVTCTYMAIKLHEPTAMSPKIFAKLSQGNYCIKQIERMEMTILQAIGWRVNGPTAMAFVRQMLSLFCEKVFPATMKNAVYDLAKVQIELVLGDYWIVSHKRSTIALAAVMNALESLQYDTHFFGMTLANHKSIAKNMNSDEISRIRTSLYQAIANLPHNGGFYSQALAGKTCRNLEMVARRARCDQHSPRSVFNSNV